MYLFTETNIFTNQEACSLSFLTNDIQLPRGKQGVHQLDPPKCEIIEHQLLRLRSLNCSVPVSSEAHYKTMT